MTAATGPDLLDVRGLTVAYRTSEGPLPAVRGVDLVVRPARSSASPASRAAASRRWPAPCCGSSRRTPQVAGEVLVLGEDVLTMGWGELRALRWAEASIVFQGALHSLNPVQRVGDQIAEPIRLHEPGLSDAQVDERVQRAARAGRPAARRAAAPTRTSSPAARSSG